LNKIPNVRIIAKGMGLEESTGKEDPLVYPLLKILSHEAYKKKRIN
jgi:hypothetical protein